MERLQKTALEAQVVMETERLRSSLLGSMTHDFQTPLAAIMGSASSLLDLQGKLDTAQAQEMLANIYDEAERLSRLVNNLLDIARLQAGSLKLHKELQPLEEVVGAALNRLEKRLADRPITTSLPADLPMVPLDASLAEHIFINLLENSLKYTPPGSPLAIAAVQKDDAIEVEVADLGPGFPPEDLDKIFEMYYRGAEDIGQKGYGLGLCHLPRHRPGPRRPDLGGKPHRRRGRHTLHFPLESSGPAISCPIFQVMGIRRREKCPVPIGWCWSLKMRRRFAGF